MVQFDQCEQPSVAGAEIKDALARWRDEFQQRRLAFDPVGDGVGPAQVVQRVFR